MLIDREGARTLILHALAQRPFMTTREIADACPKVPFVYLSFYLDECQVCAPYYHYRTAESKIEYYTLHNDAYRLLKALERRGQVRQIKVEGVQKGAWCLVPVADRVGGEEIVNG